MKLAGKIHENVGYEAQLSGKLRDFELPVESSATATPREVEVPPAAENLNVWGDPEHCPSSTIGYTSKTSYGYLTNYCLIRAADQHGALASHKR